MLLRFSIVPLIFWLVGGAFNQIADDSDDDNEDNENNDISEHERLEADLNVNFLPRFEETNLGTLSAEEASSLVAGALLEGSGVRERLLQLFGKAKSKECRELIAKHYGFFVAALGREEVAPFTNWGLSSTCPEPVYEKDEVLAEGVQANKMITEHIYQPRPEEAEYISNPGDLKILYVVLAHNDPDSTIHLVEALYEPGHAFVIHIDAKESCQETYDAIVKYGMLLDHVHVISDPHRVRVNWGGFSMVNATLQALKYSFGLLHDQSGKAAALEFHKVVHLSSTSYPIASNSEIRQLLSQFPLDANLMNIVNFPLRPSSWSYFVECDDAVHRIYDLRAPIAIEAGFDLYTASQWWIISREFAEYLASAESGTFVSGFLEYIEHVVVADETFFGTVLKNTEFCTTFHYRNFNFIEFDRWESDAPIKDRDLRKCPMKDPDLCGRSPTTLNVEDAPVLELSDNLFARKFVQPSSEGIKDMIDQWRYNREMETQQTTASDAAKMNALDFAGHGVLIVAKETLKDSVPLCLGVDFAENNNNVWLTPCFLDSVPPALQDGWETGKVLLNTIHDLNQWEIGPCSTMDGLIAFDSGTGWINVTASETSQSGPRCVLTAPGRSEELCLDGYHNWRTEYPGDEVRLSQCTRPWSQLVSFGDGRVAPQGTLFMTVPHYILDAIALKGHEQHKYMCLGVRGRGNQDENDPEKESDGKPQTPPTLNTEADHKWQPLHLWTDFEIWMTRCTNTGALIEWVLVPLMKSEEECKKDDKR